MKEYAPLTASLKRRSTTCGYCKGSGRDISRSLWGEFACPVCGGTGRRETTFEIQTWDQMYDSLLSLANKISRCEFAPDVIVGVSSGGLIPARVLCDLLNVPLLTQVDVSLGKRNGQPRIVQPVSVAVSGRKVLVVDEAADTGNSLELVKEHVTGKGAREVRTVAIYIKPWSAVEPSYYEKRTSRWVVFPWEIKRTIKSIATNSEPKKRKELDALESAGVSARLTRRFLDEIDEDRCQNR